MELEDELFELGPKMLNGVKIKTVGRMLHYPDAQFF